MKKSLLLLISFFMGITFHEVGAITIHNNSTKYIWFYGKHGGCTGSCSDPYGSNPGTCCASKKIAPQSSAVLSTGDGGGLGFFGSYPDNVYLHASYKGSETGGHEIVWDAGDPSWDAVKTFPDDFGVSSTDLAWLMPTPAPTLTQTSISKVGSFATIENSSKFNFTLKGHPISAGSSINATAWQSPSSNFAELWDSNQTIQLNGSYGNVERTINFIITDHSITITDTIGGTSSTQLINLDELIVNYIGTISNSNIVGSFTISLNITDTEVTVTNLQITKKYVSGTSVETQTSQASPIAKYVSKQ